MSEIDRVLRSNLKLKHLQLIVALDEYRHLGRSAEFLSLTQPAASKSLFEIERLFGLELFVRSTKGTEPTAYGEKVARFARAVLADFERTREEIATVASGGAGRIRVGAMVVATPVLLAQAVAKLKKESPGTTVSMEEGDLSRLLPRLRVGEIDFIVGRLEPGYAAPDLETEALYDEPMKVIVAPGHKLTRMSHSTWRDLALHPWVVPPVWASSRVKLVQMFHRHGLEMPIDIIETASFLGILTFLHQRACVGIVAADVAKYLSHLGLATSLELPVPMELPPVGLIRSRNGLRTPVSDRLLDLLRDFSRPASKRRNRLIPLPETPESPRSKPKFVNKAMQ